MSKLTFTIAVIAIFAGAVLGQDATPCTSGGSGNPTFRAQVIVLRIQRIEHDNERVQKSIDDVQDTIDMLDSQLDSEARELRETQTSVYDVDEDEGDKNPADAERRRQAYIVELESNMRSNAAKRAMHEQRRLGLIRRLDANTAQLSSLETELSKL
jgi:chromosome segregation ATPase